MSTPPPPPPPPPLPPWESLPDDVVELVGWRVLAGDLLDYVRFRAVCTQWNRSTVRPDAGRGLLDPRFHPRRWIMLSEGHGLHPGHPALDGHARFLNLSTGALVRLRLPLFRDHAVLDSTDGLLLLMRRHDTAVRLLHPFTGDVAELPPLSSLLPQMPHWYDTMTEDRKLSELSGLSRLDCAAVTVHTAACIITVMLALGTGLGQVAHAATGHRRWTLSPYNLVGKTTPFHGKLYSSCRGTDSVFVCQLDPPPPNAAEGSPPPPPKLIAECPVLPSRGTINLVQCGAELMIVGFNPAKPTDLVVYRLADITRGMVVPVTSIGEHALFLGQRTLYATQNKGLPSVVGNSIICNFRVIKTMNNGYQRCIEQYHIGTGTWSPAIDGDNSYGGGPPASPYTLIHHILTCCRHSYWSKGLIYPDNSILNGW